MKKEPDINCPLCGHKKYFSLNEYSVDTLGAKWKRDYGFDPFPALVKEKSFHRLQCSNCMMVFYNPEILGDGKFYHELSKFDWYYEDDKWEFTETLNFILGHKPNSLLEVGCGPGIFLSKVVNAVSEVEGTEMNENAIKICRQKNLNVNSIELHQIEKKYDMIVLFQVMEHLNNFNYWFTELKRLLNTNGLLIIAVPNPESFISDLEDVLLDLPPHHNAQYFKHTFEFIAGKYNLNMIDYRTDPLRFVHNQFYKQEIFSRLNEGIKRTLMDRIMYRIFPSLNKSVVDNLSFLSYSINRQNLLGLTHMAVFQNQ